MPDYYAKWYSNQLYNSVTAGGLDENEKFSKDWQSRFDGGPLDILNPKHAQYYKWWLIL